MADNVTVDLGKELVVESCAQVTNLGFGHLPLVVVRTPAAGRAGVVSPLAVQAKVLDPVVVFPPVHVVDQLPRFERAVERYSHDQTVLQDLLHARSPHGVEEVKVLGRYGALAEGHVAVRSHVAPAASDLGASDALPREHALAHLSANRVRLHVARLLTRWAGHRDLGHVSRPIGRKRSVRPVNRGVRGPVRSWSLTGMFCLAW